MIYEGDLLPLRLKYTLYPPWNDKVLHAVMARYKSCTGCLGVNFDTIIYLLLVSVMTVSLVFEV